jgi:alpha-ketoglutarate-dependent taurine dioxygenase
VIWDNRATMHRATPSTTASIVGAGRVTTLDIEQPAAVATSA